MDNVIVLNQANRRLLTEKGKRLPVQAGSPLWMVIVLAALVPLVWAMYLSMRLYFEVPISLESMVSPLIVSAAYFFNFLIHVRRYQHRRRLQGSGEIRHGRIVSVKPWPLLSYYATLRYEIPADDDAVLAGKRVINRWTREQITPETRIAVLYADPKTHFVL